MIESTVRSNRVAGSFGPLPVSAEGVALRCASMTGAAAKQRKKGAGRNNTNTTWPHRRLILGSSR